MGRRRHHLALAGLAFSLMLAAADSGRAEDRPADSLLQEKCNLCHADKRIYTMDASKIKDTIERMRKMNPDWISTIQSDHIAEVVSKIVNDPNIMAQRTAWQESLDRGEALFGNKALGKKGAACADCHKPTAFHQIADAYPRWDAKRKAFVSLDEAIAIMLRDKVEAELTPNDPRVMDLLIYLKSR
jgi:cytochrome c553